MGRNKELDGPNLFGKTSLKSKLLLYFVQDPAEVNERLI